MTNFPEIHPADASPEISALYADIRSVSGVPMVNLIWRHFAAIPGILQWAWTGVRPIIASQEMIAARARLVDAVDIPPLPVLSHDTLRSHGLDAANLKAFQSMVNDYVRGNCTNIVALTAIRLRLEGHSKPSPVLSIAPQPTLGALLPPLPKIDHLPNELAAKIRTLAEKHEGADGAVIPSLYLELARWPALVDQFPVWLSSLYAVQALHTARESACRAAEIEAAALLPELGPLPENVAEMRPALERFTRKIIPALIPVCIAAQRLTSTS